MSTWVYTRNSNAWSKEHWEVGYYTPSGIWISVSEHPSEEEAAARVHYLNGGCSNC